VSIHLSRQRWCVVPCVLAFFVPHLESLAQDAVAAWLIGGATPHGTRVFSASPGEFMARVVIRRPPNPQAGTLLSPVHEDDTPEEKRLRFSETFYARYSWMPAVGSDGLCSVSALDVGSAEPRSSAKRTPVMLLPILHPVSAAYGRTHRWPHRYMSDGRMYRHWIGSRLYGLADRTHVLIDPTCHAWHILPGPETCEMAQGYEGVPIPKRLGRSPFYFIPEFGPHMPALTSSCRLGDSILVASSKGLLAWLDLCPRPVWREGVDRRFKDKQVLCRSDPGHERVFLYARATDEEAWACHTSADGKEWQTQPALDVATAETPILSAEGYVCVLYGRDGVQECAVRTRGAAGHGDLGDPVQLPPTALVLDVRETPGHEALLLVGVPQESGVLSLSFHRLPLPGAREGSR